jgi:YbbR domain-containing protein
VTRINVTQAFTRLATDAYTVTRVAAGAYDANGNWVPSVADPTEIAITASVQPLTARERQLLPENIRSKDTRKVYTQTELQSGSSSTGQSADEIEIDSEDYVVNSVETWPAEPPFYVAVVALKGQG